MEIRSKIDEIDRIAVRLPADTTFYGTPMHVAMAVDADGEASVPVLLRKAVTAHRTDLARMKRENVALEQEVRRLRREVSRLQPSPTEPASQPDSRFRYSAERLSATRAKLDLSAADFGLLVGASGLSIYKWERGTKPREKFMPALAAAMRMGKKEASAQLLKLKQSD